MAIRLIITNAAGTDHVEQVFDDEEAVGLLAKGAATLASLQSQPPFAVLNWLLEVLDDQMSLGPQVLDAELLSKAQQHLIADGSLQSIVEGHYLPWTNGPQLRKEVSKRLLAPNPGALEAKSALASVLYEYLDKRAGRVSRRGISAEQIEAERLVPTGESDFLHETVDYWELSSTWYDFYKRLPKIDNEIQGRLSRGLSEGRILCCRSSQGADVLVHPVETQTPRFRTYNKDHWYVFNSDLPKAWFADTRPIHKRRNDASAWMLGAVEHFRNLGRRVTRKDLVSTAMKKFDLSQNASNDAWDAVSKEADLSLGNIPSDQRVTNEELLTYEK